MARIGQLDRSLTDLLQMRQNSVRRKLYRNVSREHIYYPYSHSICQMKQGWDADEAFRSNRAQLSY